MENFILKRLWLDRDKHAKGWGWLMDRGNLGKTEQVDYTTIYHTSGEPQSNRFFRLPNILK